MNLIIKNCKNYQLCTTNTVNSVQASKIVLQTLCGQHIFNQQDFNLKSFFIFTRVKSLLSNNYMLGRNDSKSIKSITVLDESIRISKDDYFSLTDIAKYKNIEDPNGVIRNWIRNREIIEFLGLWEILNNDYFNPIEFDGFRNASGTNHFTMSPQKWIRGVNSIGITSKSGRYGGAYAHKDIALQFSSWISPEIHLHIIKEFQRLKENIKNDLVWKSF